MASPCGLNLLLVGEFEFVVGSLLCSERFSGYSGFPLSLKSNISKFQFDPVIHGHFKSETSSCELLGAPLVNKLHLHLLPQQSLQQRSFRSIKELFTYDQRDCNMSLQTSLQEED